MNPWWCVVLVIACICSRNCLHGPENVIDGRPLCLEVSFLVCIRASITVLASSICQSLKEAISVLDSYERFLHNTDSMFFFNVKSILLNTENHLFFYVKSILLDTESHLFCVKLILLGTESHLAKEKKKSKGVCE